MLIGFLWPLSACPDPLILVFATHCISSLLMLQFSQTCGPFGIIHKATVAAGAKTVSFLPSNKTGTSESAASVLGERARPCRQGSVSIKLPLEHSSRMSKKQKNRAKGRQSTLRDMEAAVEDTKYELEYASYYDQYARRRCNTRRRSRR